MKEDLARAELNASQLRMTADATHDMQETLRIEMDARMSRQDQLLLAIQTKPSLKNEATSSGISSPIKKLLDSYNDLDEHSKQALLLTAISSGNVELQRTLFALRDDDKNTNNPGSLAKLAKELIKLADTYKVPELKFEEQATKQRYNYRNWITKLRPILAMFSHTSSVIKEDEIIPFQNPNCIGNKALYLLIGSRVDGYFQRAIKQFKGKGDKALELVKLQCANVNALDKHHFHHLFTSIRIKHNESAMSYLRRFIYAKTEAEGASNTYTETQLVDFALSGLFLTKNLKYETAIQLYNLERENGKQFTLQEIEQKFFSINEKSARNQAFTRLSLGSAARSQNDYRHKRGNGNGRGFNGGRNTNKGRVPRRQGSYQNNTTEHAHLATHSNSIICYNCGEQPGHTAPKCPKPKQQNKRTTPHTTQPA